MHARVEERPRGDKPSCANPAVVITCVVEYVIDPAKTEAFERFARRWMELVGRHGGIHHGYFPGEASG